VETLGARIRYLTRVHCSLLRYWQRSLAVLARVVDSCAPTYTADAGLLARESGAGLERNHVGFERIAYDRAERACGQPAGDGDHLQQRSNANTPGYTREVSVVAAGDPVEIGSLSVGTGVVLDKIESLRDSMLQIQINQATQQNSSLNASLQQLKQIQTQFASSTSGIGADISNFFNSLQQLSPNPRT